MDCNRLFVVGGSMMEKNDCDALSRSFVRVSIARVFGYVGKDKRAG